MKTSIKLHTNHVLHSTLFWSVRASWFYLYEEFHSFQHSTVSFLFFKHCCNESRLCYFNNPDLWCSVILSYLLYVTLFTSLERCRYDANKLKRIRILSFFKFNISILIQFYVTTILCVF
ncbi:hypothetical protein CDL12_13762 [Handroanthus impetiginosus]|uniref:Uncharacterized protein n=1 Tax=Handroanthus impetiginosus TaxID=429701 RepID=A0A2G9H7X0_9LAMI|nr:hypothetical protein CDL12_13762 [Handroanthus impetiginosus]